MLYAISKDVETELTARGCPLPVIYGPEPVADLALVRSRIVIERPRESGDTIGPPRAHKHNPRRAAERGIAARVRIYAHATVEGARVQDHESVAEQAAGLIVVALQIAIARQKTTAAFSSSGYVAPAALEIPELRVWPGVVYEIDLTVQRGVFDRTWAGASKDTNEFSITTSGTCTTTAAPDP